MEIGLIILASAALCSGAILAGAAGQKIDAPVLLVFLLVGMLAGNEGPGGIALDASPTIIVWASVALAAILFEGGVRTKYSVFRTGAAPGLTLAVAGTLLTAFIVAPVAKWVFNVDWQIALLIGATVSATDAAAVFALAATGLKMPERVSAVLEVESGNNDPIAIMLVVGLATSLTIAPVSALGWIVMFFQKISIGILCGLVAGGAIPFLLRRANLGGGLRSILAGSVGFVGFGLAETLGGSGFLAIYLAGLVFAARAPYEAERTGPLFDGLAWLAQTGLFLLLGLVITPSHLAGVVIPSLWIALALIFLARPIAVAITLSPFRFKRKEMGFIAWVGLRGATPIYLGLIPAAFGVANGNLYLSTAAVVVLLSLVIQGWTAPVVGRALGLSEDSDNSIERGETIARLSAVTGTVAVASWFAVSFAPTTNVMLVDPDTPQDLRAALDSEFETPAGFPDGFSNLPTEDRQPLFIETIAAVVARSNAEIRVDRAELIALRDQQLSGRPLTLSQDADVNEIARRYGLTYQSIDQLLNGIDEVPPRLATAQAAIATGWGGSSVMVSRNAVFGLSLNQGYPTLLDAANSLARLYASHPDFENLRQVRATIRADGLEPSAEDLLPHIGRFVDDSDAYVQQIGSVLAGVREPVD
ncbi:MAG: potassium/proton antiporter [Pseudomonadota bacterium]